MTVRARKGGFSRYVAMAAVLTVVPFAASAQAARPLAMDPVLGGTLKIVAAYGPDHLDPVPAYYNADYVLERAYTRQLVTYRSVPDRSFSSAGWHTDITPTADVAAQVPSVRNGGITHGGTVYTFHIRPGVDWNTHPARQVTAGDFVREFKAFCNPAPGGFIGNLAYYADTIIGLTAYCNAETSYFAHPAHPITAANIARFQNTHAIAGMAAVNRLTLQFRLYAPASDFLYMLALPFASARPVEYDRYLPNSLRLDEHIVSDGPYTITSYTPGASIVLTKNPAWRQSTDPARHQYVSRITVTMGVTNAATQVNDLRLGRYDLMLDTGIPPRAIPRLRHDPRFHIWPGNFMVPYIVFNFRSPNSRHAIGDLAVRKAIEFGINKVAVQNALGGPAVAQILNSAQPPGNLGHLTLNPYPTPGSTGDTARCRAELARSGHARRLELKFDYLNDAENSAVFAAIKASLARCGIRLIAHPLPGYEFFIDISDTSQTNKPGTFDLASPGWIPDWYGNNGRTLLDPLFRTHCVLNTNNYGCYSNRKVDQLMTKAETARTQPQAGILWLQAVRQIMASAAIVPLISGLSPIYASSRTRQAGLRSGVVSLPNIDGPDITNIWVR